MKQLIVQVDSFTDTPFAGNPAGVCLLNGPADEDWMRLIAAEMNLSETAFLYPEGDGFRLRWFTPAVEVALCGHATLASAHVLWEDGHLPVDKPALFHTKSGLLTAVRDGGLISMDFPARPVVECDPPEGLIESLGVNPVTVARNESDFLVELGGVTEVRQCAPEFSRLGRVDARGVMITAGSDDGTCDFVSRFFAPAVGVDEDPVTGSAHCALGPYWAAKLGRPIVTGCQLSRRGGRVRVTVEGARVLLAGKAVTVLRCVLV